MKHWDDEAPAPQFRTRPSAKPPRRNKLVELKRAIRECAVMPDGEIDCLGYVAAIRHLRGAHDRLAREVVDARCERLAAAAWVLDRAEQYGNSDRVRAAFDEVMVGIANGEHMAAFRHGELDDLLDAPFLRRARDGERYDDTTREGIARLNVAHLEEGQ